jgi:hypothetical protein
VSPMRRSDDRRPDPLGAPLATVTLGFDTS